MKNLINSLIAFVFVLLTATYCNAFDQNLVQQYFNTFHHIEGNFKQINPDQSTQEGNFYINRTSHEFKFVYPDQTVYSNDGKTLIAHDNGDGSDTAIDIHNTFADLILNGKLNANYFTFNDDGDNILVSYQNDNGTITLKFNHNKDKLVLLGWNITDNDGSTTVVEIN